MLKSQSEEIQVFRAVSDIAFREDASGLARQAARALTLCTRAAAAVYWRADDAETKPMAAIDPHLLSVDATDLQRRVDTLGAIGEDPRAGALWRGVYSLS